MLKKMLSMLLVMAMLLSMMPTVIAASPEETPITEVTDNKVTPETVPYGVTIFMGSVTSAPGDTVDIPVSLDYAFTEKVTELQIRLATNSLLTLNSITAAEGLAEGLTVTQTGTTDYPNLVLKMEDGSAFTLPKGQIAVLNYTVSADAPGGDIAVSGADGSAYTWVYIENDTTKYDGKTVDHTNLPGNITVAAAEGLIALTAPVLPSEGHAVAYNEITLAAPAASSEDETAVVQYRYSLDGAHWSAWQTSVSFYNVVGGTKYYFQARYQTTAEGKTSSAASTVLELTTPETPWFNVTFRVIGASLPTAKPSIKSSSADYKGAVYQNWLKTVSYQALAGSTAEDLIYQALTNAGFTYTEGKPGTMSITAPKEYGGHELKKNTNNTGTSSAWMITINNGGEFRTESYSRFTEELENGDEIILHFVFSTSYERNGKAWESNTWAVPDITPAEYSTSTTAIAMINAIGRVTPDSKAAIDAARAAYEAVPESAKIYVTNYETLTAAEATYQVILDNASTRTPLPAPVIAAGTAGLYTVTPTVTVEGVDAELYSVAYRVSLDGTNWGIWQTGDTMEKLLPNTTYYIQAKTQTNDWALYGDSAESNVITLTTAGADATRVEVSNRDTLREALQNAATDGSLTIVDIVADILIDDISGENYRVDLPAGANVLLTSSNGSKYYFNEPGEYSFIGISTGTTVTVRDLYVGTIAGSSDLTPAAEGQRIFAFLDNTGVINLENVTMFATHSAGLIGYNSYNNGAWTGTVNIYSGVLNNVLDRNVMSLLSGATVNLIPTGDIVLEGGLGKCTQVNILSLFGTKLSSAAYTDDLVNFAQLDVNALMPTMAYGKGLRLNVTADNKVPPVAMEELVVLPADHENAANADVTYVIGDNDISFTYKDRADAVYQIRFNKWGTEASDFFYTRGDDLTPDDITDDNGALNHTRTYSGLTQDTQYSFTIRYSSLSSSYTDVETTITLKTTYTPVALDAPALSDEAEKTDTTITVTAPAASAQDATASFLYRIRKAGTEDWSDWQESVTFTGLEPYTDYEIQAMYDAQHYLWLDSAESNTITIKTKASTMKAPELSEEVPAVTFDSITVPVPSVSTDDADAEVWYRIGTLKEQTVGLLDTTVTEDQIAWSDWQESNVFTGLEADTTYYIQAQYVTEKAQWLNSELSQIITVKTATNESAPHFKVESASGKAGSEVQLIISLNNNPGIIAIAMQVGYDASKLQLVSVQDLKLLPNSTFSNELTANPYYLSWEDSTAASNLTANGDLVILTFKILEDCAVGDTADITITYDAGNVYDFDFNKVNFAVINGVVTVTSHDWSEPTYTWSDDHTSCTATRACTCCDVPVTDEETVEASFVTTPPTETEKGSTIYTAVFTKTGFETQAYTKVLAATGTAVEMDPVQGCVGTTVRVEVSIRNNPGIVGAELKGTYNADLLEFVDVENGQLLPEMLAVIENGAIYISWSEIQDNISGDGVIATLIFKIKDTASVGDVAAIEITSFLAHDTQLLDVEFNTADGSVTVADHTWNAWEYTWSSDYTTCTAERAMSCGCGETEKQTVKTSVVNKDCTSITYLAHFTVEGAEDQTETVTISDHDYVVSGNEDGSEIIYTCPECGDSYTETVESDDAKFQLSDAKGRVGDTVEITVSIVNNPGLIMAGFTVSYDDAVLKLKEVKDAGVFESVDVNGNYITLGSMDEKGDTTADTIVVTLIFEIIADVNGVYDISISYDSDAIYNFNGENVYFAVDNGSVEVYSYLLGDVNRDGVVDIKDVTVLRRYLAGMVVAEDIDLLAADCNCDGSVDIKDVTILRRFLAGIAELG